MAFLPDYMVSSVVILSHIPDRVMSIPDGVKSIPGMMALILFRNFHGFPSRLDSITSFDLVAYLR